jgi:hypothetical protein
LKPIDNFLAWLKSLLNQDVATKGDASAVAETNESGNQNAKMDASGCCEGKVHIAYRGISDDRLYMAYGRKWPEVKYFRQRGIRVFCADCRRKLYP